MSTETKDGAKTEEPRRSKLRTGSDRAFCEDSGLEEVWVGRGRQTAFMGRWCTTTKSHTRVRVLHADGDCKRPGKTELVKEKNPLSHPMEFADFRDQRLLLLFTLHHTTPSIISGVLHSTD